MFKSIGQNPVPAWYELSVQGPATLALDVHRASVEHLDKNVPWDKFVERIAAERGLLPFRRPYPPAGCGFGAPLNWIPSGRPDWERWAIPLVGPKGTETHSQAECLLHVRATLAVLFEFGLNPFDCDGGRTDSPEEQLLLIEQLRLPNPDQSGNGSGAVSATVTSPVCRWVAARADGEGCWPIEEAMDQAANVLLPGWGGFTFRSDRPRKIHFNLPSGERGGLDPESNPPHGEETGYGLCPHNIDTGLQQIVLLVGLAKLHDLVRAWQRAGEPK